MIRFNCTGCGMLIQAPDAAGGKVSKCPGCAIHLVIPVVPPPAPPSIRATPVPSVPVPAATVQAPPVAAPPYAPEPVATQGGFLDDLLGDTSPPPSHAPAASSPASSSGSHRGPQRKSASGSAGKAAGKKSGMSPAAVRNLAIAAIGAGVLAAALCWLPFAGPALGLIGAALAMLTIVLSSARKNASMGLPLAGVGVSLIGMLAGVYFTYQFLSAPPAGTQVAANAAPTGADAAKPDAVAEQANKKAAANPALAMTTQFSEGAVLALAGGKASDVRDPLKFSMGAVRGLYAAGESEPKVAAADRAAVKRKGKVPQLVFGGSGIDGSQSLAVAGDSDSTKMPADSGGSEDKAADPPAPVKWAAADKGEAQDLDDVHVTITKVTQGRVAIAGKDIGVDLTGESYLTVWLKIENKAGVGDVAYTSWMDPEAAKGAVKAELIDEEGRPYKICPLNKGEVISGVKPTPSIGSNSSITDAIAFALPKEEVKTLRLTLPGQAVGQKGDLHFEIPWAMVKAEESNPLIGGIGNQ